MENIITTITLNEKETVAFKKFKNKKRFKKLAYIGATGGHFGLKIIYTSIGLVIVAFAWDGTEEDITDYSSY